MIVGLISASSSVDAHQLTAAQPLMAMLVAAEHYDSKPLTLVGSGIRVVIYCSYREDALTLGADVNSLPSNPTEGEWRLYVPCAPDDLVWAKADMKKRAPRLHLHGLDEAVPASNEDDEIASGAPVLDWGAL